MTWKGLYMLFSLLGLTTVMPFMLLLARLPSLTCSWCKMLQLFIAGSKSTSSKASSKSTSHPYWPHSLHHQGHSGPPTRWSWLSLGQSWSTGEVVLPNLLPPNCWTSCLYMLGWALHCQFSSLVLKHIFIPWLLIQYLSCPCLSLWLS